MAEKVLGYCYNLLMVTFNKNWVQLAIINHRLKFFYVNYIIQSHAVQTEIGILNTCGAKSEHTQKNAPRNIFSVTKNFRVLHIQSNTAIFHLVVQL